MFKYLVWETCESEDMALLAAKAYQVGLLDGLLAALDVARKAECKNLEAALYMAVSEVLEEYIEISRHELPFFVLQKELARSSKNLAPVVVKPQVAQG